MFLCGFVFRSMLCDFSSVFASTVSTSILFAFGTQLLEIARIFLWNFSNGFLYTSYKGIEARERWNLTYPDKYTRKKKFNLSCATQGTHLHCRTSLFFSTVGGKVNYHKSSLVTKVLLTTYSFLSLVSPTHDRLHKGHKFV